jgi:cytochrome c553
VGVALLATPYCWSETLSKHLAKCATCHGVQGNSIEPNIPSLAGQPKVFVENQLVLIREGMRDIPQMKGVLDNTSDDELSALAQHFAALPATKSNAKPKQALYKRGEVLAKDMRCGICHLPNFVGREQMPRLAGQREDYLLLTVRSMKSNQVTGRDPIMTATLYGISDADLEAIAHYLAHTSP